MKLTASENSLKLAENQKKRAYLATIDFQGLLCVNFRKGNRIGIWMIFFTVYGLPSLKLTASLPLKIGAWKTTFLLGRSIFRGYVSLKECSA